MKKNEFTPTLPDINGDCLLFAPQNFRAKFINFSKPVIRYTLLQPHEFDVENLENEARNWLAKAIKIYSSIDNKYLKAVFDFLYFY